MSADPPHPAAILTAAPAAAPAATTTRPPGPPQPRVACSGPYRLHMLVPHGNGVVDACDCGRQHIVLGRTYLYCTCGRCPNQPWSDGACTPPFVPTELKVDVAQSFVLVCGCKRTSDRSGLCDGSHATKVDAASLLW